MSKSGTIQRKDTTHTLIFFYGIQDVKTLVAFASCTKQLYFALNLCAFALSIHLALLVALHLIQLGHFVGSLLVLLLDLQLKLELR
jgi:hypothetical protein